MPGNPELPAQARAILDFWFGEIDRKLWFGKDDEFDRLLEQRFGDLNRQALAGAYADWAETPEGLLALVILLDQFSRNLYRDQSTAFAGDDRALALTIRAMDLGWDRTLSNEQRIFLYMPLMHAEDPRMQERSIAAFEALGEPENLKFAHLHKRIIDRFGRYPHRNEALGRRSTPEEIAFLDEPNSSF